jgi:hypothetical protein
MRKALWPVFMLSRQPATVRDCSSTWTKAAAACVLAVALMHPGTAVRSEDLEPAFTKIANDGTALAAAAVHGSAGADWACSKDDVSGRLWEVNTRDGGLRDRKWTYTPYDSDPTTNGGYPGYRDTTSGECVRSAMPGGSCNTEAYVEAVNEMRLCGYSDWRLPTAAELVAVARQSDDSVAGTTPHLLPNTAHGWYWTGVEHVGVTAFSRVVLLPPAGRPAFYDGSYMVLLVRGPRAARLDER